ncbi:ferric reductase-like transmembrane domain-containing protein [Verrucomicrobiota bacterium]
MSKIARAFLSSRIHLIILFISYVAINLLLVIQAFAHSDNDTVNVYLKIGRACGSCIKFHAVLILLPVLRSTLSWLRRRFRKQGVFVKNPLGLHRFIGIAMYVLVVLHICGYLAYYATLSYPFHSLVLGSQPDLVCSMKTSMYEHVTDDRSIQAVEDWITRGTSQEEYGTTIRQILSRDCTSCHNRSSTMTDACTYLPLTTYADALSLAGKGYGFKTMSRKAWVHLTGLLLFLIFTVLVFFASEFVRRKHYSIFRLTHFLFAPWIFVALIHAPGIKIWIAVPLLLYIIEKVFSVIKRKKA